MRGVKFGDKHSLNDYGLFLKSKEIGTPSLKKDVVNVSGMNGLLDLSESLTGYPIYDNRSLKFEFYSIDQTDEIWASTLSKILSDIHGKKMRIVLDDDNDYFYYGRVDVSNYEIKYNVGTIKIECDCDPFKWEFNLISGNAGDDCITYKQICESNQQSAEVSVMFMNEDNGNWVVGRTVEGYARYYHVCIKNNLFTLNHVYYFSSFGSIVGISARVGTYDQILSNDEGTRYGDGVEHITKITSSGYGAIDLKAPASSVVEHFFERVTPVCVDLTAIFGAGNEPTSLSDSRVDMVRGVLEKTKEYVSSEDAVILSNGDSTSNLSVFLWSEEDNTIKINGVGYSISRGYNDVAGVLSPGFNILTFDYDGFAYNYRRGWL